MGSWRTGTLKQYKTYLSRFVHFARHSNVDVRLANVKVVLDFLLDMYDQGYSYSAINTARSAVSMLTAAAGRDNLGSHPLIKRFMKAVFNGRPALPRYQFVWDTDTVLDYLKQQDILSLSLKELSARLAILLALTSGQRCQTLHALDLRDASVSSVGVKFVVSSIVKHSRVNKPQPEIMVKPFTTEQKLCLFTTLSRYLTVTQTLRNNNTKLFISYIRPHRPITKDTFSRWIKWIMQLAGIDTSIFKAHSTRAAATSKAMAKDIPLETIMTAAGWNRTSTFYKFYYKTIATTADFNLLN